MKKTRIAAMSDIHIGRQLNDFREHFQQLPQTADILVLCGDLTDRGSEEEIEAVITQLSGCTIPIITVLGNHDYENGSEHILTIRLQEAGVTVLNGTSCIQNDIGFAGIKGFCGGFGTYSLAPWGEKAIKEFVQEAVNESLQLEKALSELQTKRKVVVMHYAPIPETLKGEPLEIYPFLGSSRLVGPVDQYKPDVVFHGHAHHGILQGATPQGIPVYNVSVEIVEKINKGKPYFILEI